MVEQRCRARCVILDGKIQAMTGGDHNHPPHTEKISKILLRNQTVKLMPSVGQSVVAEADSNELIYEEREEHHFYLPEYEEDEDQYAYGKNNVNIM